MTTIKTLVLALTLSITPCAIATSVAQAAEPAAVKPEMKKLETHLKEHPQTYPATRAELLAACENLKDFSAGEKAWYAAHLPEGTYKSAGEVLKALRVK